MSDELTPLEEWARDAFVEIDSFTRVHARGYDSYLATMLRSLHSRLPLHLHPSDCDGCFVYEEPIESATAGKE